MKKFLVIFILGLLWSNVVLAAKITLSCQTTSMTVYTEDVKTGKRERTTFDWHLDPQPFLIDITKNNWIFENDIFAKMYIDYEAMNFIEDGVGKKYFTAIYTEIHRYTGSYYRTRIRFPEEDFKRMNDLYKKENRLLFRGAVGKYGRSDLLTDTTIAKCEKIEKKF